MNIQSLWAMLILLISISTSTYAFEGKNNTYASLLASANNEQVILAAQSLYTENSTNTKLLDIAAELLWFGSKQEAHISSDGLSWLAKAIGQSKLTRYKTILKNVDANMAILEANYKPKVELEFDDEEDEDSPETKSETRVKGSTRPKYTSFWAGSIAASTIDDIHTEINHSKVRKYIATALDNLTDQSSIDFVAGKMDHQVLIKNINTSKQAVIKNRQELDFSQIKRGHSLDDIYDKFGLPDSPAVYYISKQKPFVGRVLLAQLQINYNNAAVLQLLHREDDYDDNDEQPGWYVHRVYSFQPDGLKAGLLSQNLSQLRKNARGIYHGKLFDTEILDIVAKRLWDSRDIEVSPLDDAFAWLCKGIGESGNSRYRTIMQNLAENAKNEKIKSYANKQIELLKNGNEQQYILQ